MNYLALLRGVNVGGNSILRMEELRTCLEKIGLDQVRTYIQSGNVLFAAPKQPAGRLAGRVEVAIEQRFAMPVGVAVFSAREWQEVMTQAPNWWGAREDWKHNLVALLPGTKPAEVLAAMGDLKPEMETVAAGTGVVYQSLSKDFSGRTSSDKLARHPINRRVTVRNSNTARKLAQLLAAEKTP